MANTGMFYLKRYWPHVLLLYPLSADINQNICNFSGTNMHEEPRFVQLEEAQPLKRGPIVELMKNVITKTQVSKSDFNAYLTPTSSYLHQIIEVVGSDDVSEYFSHQLLPGATEEKLEDLKIEVYHSGNQICLRYARLNELESENLEEEEGGFSWYFKKFDLRNLLPSTSPYSYLVANLSKSSDKEVIESMENVYFTSTILTADNSPMFGKYYEMKRKFMTSLYFDTYSLYAYIFKKKEIVEPAHEDLKEVESLLDRPKPKRST